MTTLPIVTHAREALSGRPDLLGLLDDAVIALFELLPVEQKALAAILLADGDVDEAARLAGTAAGAFSMALNNLAARGLVAVKDGRADLAGLQQRLKVETSSEAERVEGIPRPTIVLRGIVETAHALGRSSPNQAAALGRAYSFIYGRRAGNFPVLGQIAKALGIQRAVQFLLEHALDQFEKDPLMELLPQALWLAKGIKSYGIRPEGAPDEEAQRKERVAEAREAWVERMRRWLECETEDGALDTLYQCEEDNGISEYQAKMTERQIKLDFQRWREEGQPEL